MAIPCAACGRPVHEHAAQCPHCGGPSGVAADRTMTAEERAATMELALREAEAHTPPPSPLYAGDTIDPEVALIGAVGAAVVAAVGAVIDEASAGPALPRAIARERAPAPVVPEPSHEPEPAPPPGDTPRYLK